MVPALMVVNGLVVALGASVVEVQEGQGAAVLVAMLFYFPIALIVPITQNPESAFSIILSLIPFSAPFTTALRLMVIDVPWWQIGVSVGLLLLMAIFSVWLAQQAFRLGMLQYGKKLSFRQIFGRAEKQQPERRVR
jgi:ABC-2 type transport system permease protein